MSKKSKPLPIVTNVEITDIAAEGKAIAKIDNMIVFVPYVVPGDIVDLQLSRRKKNYAEGRPIRFEKYSNTRVNATCEHFGVCGGCKWQILPYTEQLKFKHKQVTDHLNRIGKIELPVIQPIIGSDKTLFYRNKLEFTFSNKKWLTQEQINTGVSFDELNMNAVGFHIPGCFDKVLDINKCWLQDDISNSIRNFVRQYCFSRNYSFFDLKNKGGLMRTLIVRTSSTGEIMLIVVFYDDDKEKREDLLLAIANQFPQITSLLYIINQKANDTITDQQVLTWKGTDYIYEKMENLKFKIGPKSFYQTNSQQAYNLYKITRDFADLNPDQLVYDLYTGTGTIANFVAPQARQVIGIEYVEDAIKDAKFNSQINNIHNTLFYAGDMKDILTQDFINQHGRPDVIITDPPRAGMHEDVINSILFAEPKRIVYVSCNPATQARDLNILDSKYRVDKIQPVDMFPHTHHIENVVLLKLKTI